MVAEAGLQTFHAVFGSFAYINSRSAHMKSCRDIFEGSNADSDSVSSPVRCISKETCRAIENPTDKLGLGSLIST